MKIISTVTLDLQKPNNEIVFAMQGDKLTRYVLASLRDGAAAWSVPGTVDTVKVRCKKPDGTVCYYDELEDGSTAYTIIGSTVEVGLAEQVMTVAGRFGVDICFLDGDDTLLSCFSFLLDVKAASATAAEIAASEDYITGTIVDISATVTQYWQESNDGANVPTGAWIDHPPTTISANYLWSKTVTLYSNGAETVTYNVGYHGTTGAGTVSKVGNVSPDGTGDVPFKALCNVLFPVGWHIITTKTPEQFNPNNYYGGTWDQIKDVFILAAGDVYTGTGGVASNEVNFANGQAHIGFGDNYTGAIYLARKSVNVAQFTPGNKAAVTFEGANGESIDATALSGTQTLNNMPPYITRYVWERKTLASV